MTSEISSALNNILYLLTFLVMLTVYYQWRWSQTCRRKIQVLVVRADGHGDYEYAPQAGGSVSLRDPKSNTTRLWPINELATVSVPYPASGLVPRFLQKTIQQVVVDEKDWEPLINRGPHRNNLASPDVIAALAQFATVLTDPKQKEALEMYKDQLITTPTRHIIASPAVLGNLMHEKITEAVITVNKEMIDDIGKLTKRLNRMVSPTVFYIGIGAILAVLFYVIFQVTEMTEQLDAICQAIGL